MANLEITKRERLDTWLMRKYPDFSRAFLQKLCNENKVLVNENPQKSGFKLRGDESIHVNHDMKNSLPDIPDINLNIIYEDDNVVVIDKPAGVLSHGLTKFLSEPSVASFLRQKLNKEASSRSDLENKVKSNKNWKPEDLRFGIVHRLDRVTSGVMICAKNLETMRMLQKQFHDRKVTKQYVAIIQGTLKEKEAIIDLPLGRNPKAPATWRVDQNGKPAITQYKLIKSSNTYSFVELYPKTGRTHQLRVHMQYLGHPIVGDFLYKGVKADRLYLHAQKLTINIPNVGDKLFEAKIPNEFTKLMNI